MSDMQKLYISMGVPRRYIPFLTSMQHIELEKWDMENNMDAINDWINKKGPKQAVTRKGFLLYHIRMTTEGGFKWNYPH